MSRLIRNDKDSRKSKENKTSGASNTGMVPLSNDVIVEHLKKCQAIAGTYAQDAFQNYMVQFDNDLNLKMEGAKTNNEMTELVGVQRLFRRNRQELERYYCGYIAEGFVKFKKKDLDTKLEGGDDEHSEELSLVANDELDETIILTTMVQKLDAFYAEPIWALNQRFAILNGGERVVEASNPAAPIQLCESFRRALRLIPMPIFVKNLAYKGYEKKLSDVTKHILEDINQYLKQSGILPNLRYMPVQSHPEGGSAKPGGQAEELCPSGIDNAIPPRYDQDMQQVAMPNPAESTANYQSALLQSIRGLQASMRGPAQQSGTGRRLTDGIPVGEGAAGYGANPLGAFIPRTGPASASDVFISSDQLLSALQNVQASNSGVVNAQSSSGQLVPIDLQQVLMALGQQVQEGTEGDDGKVSDSDLHTIDLVGLVFEYMLKDENLPSSVKALLSYLHTPFLKLAFSDPTFFEQPEHPARMLLNGLAEAGTRWIGNDGSVQYDMYNRIKGVVELVLREFKNDVRVMAEALMEFNAYTKNIIRRQELMEKRATEKAQGEERLREVKIKVNEAVSERTGGKELPSAVLLFVLQPWSDYMSFALLRYGEESEKWTSAIDLVDDLIWAIEPKTNKEDIARQALLAAEVLKRAEVGFETIGYDQTKGAKLLEAITALFDMAQRSQKAEPAPAPMRDKLEKIAAEKAGQVQITDDDISQEEGKIIENLKLMEFGTWFEFEGGKRQKVAWYNARTSHYMLVDQMGKKVAMMSGADIARKMIAKQAKIIAGSSKPFFERALENIFQKLNAQAEAQAQPGEENQLGDQN